MGRRHRLRPRRLCRTERRSALRTGSWVEEEGEETADRWIRISADGEEEITWKTA
jgi:hypothetical protein